MVFVVPNPASYQPNDRGSSAQLRKNNLLPPEIGPDTALRLSTVYLALFPTEVESLGMGILMLMLASG